MQTEAAAPVRGCRKALLHVVLGDDVLDVVLGDGLGREQHPDLTSRLPVGSCEDLAGDLVGGLGVALLASASASAAEALASSFSGLNTVEYWSPVSTALQAGTRWRPGP